ncbi:unnamed protein product [Rotaria sp. Silwood1]|nr:unnamed protein product [Rotaria sp. Silwood1]CAF1565099.1 unnamed protein product [Rotaria sp. Silwood1]
MTGRIIADNYRIESKLGAGSFGQVYLCEHIHTHEQWAMKIESQIMNNNPQLSIEHKIYTILQGGKGFPKIDYYGNEGTYDILIIELLGPSLEDLFNYCNRKFTLKTALMLVDQMITRIEYVHTCHLVHRDIKPDNFLMGVKSMGNTVYIIDFGLSKRYRDPKSLVHIPWKSNKSLTGTARYASINAHKGSEQSRRDDLEAISYVFMYFIMGTLPWQGLQATARKSKFERIAEMKMKMTSEQICKNYPKECILFLNYCRTLIFDHRPDYNYLRHLFRYLLYQKGDQYDYEYDWIILHRNKRLSTLHIINPIDGENSLLSEQTVPNGPRPWPIVGNLLQLGYRPYETIYNWSKMPKYGPIFRLQLGSQSVIVLNSTSVIREALHDHSEAFAGRPYLHMIHETLHGKGVISAPYGREFNEHKNFLIKSFNRFGRRRRSSLENGCLDEVRLVAEKLREKQSTPFRIGNMLSQIACNNICTLTFGRYFETMNMSNLFEKINENFNQTATIACFNFLPFTRRFKKNIFENVNDCNRVIQKLVDERETNFDSESVNNIVDAYLDEMNRHRHFSKENLDSLVQDLFVAGTETVSNTLNWTIFYIVSHSYVQEKIHEEIDRIIGKDRPPCDKDRIQMPYIEAVLLESMRCHCAGPILLPRATTHDITFQNYFIPKDTFILVNMWSAMKDEKQWLEPDKFQPERFLDENNKLKDVNHPAMMPFSVGKRACTGEQIAKIQLFLILVSLFQKFEFHFVDGWIPKDLRGQPGITLRPPNCQYQAFVR